MENMEEQDRVRQLQRRWEEGGGCEGRDFDNQVHSGAFVSSVLAYDVYGFIEQNISF